MGLSNLFIFDSLSKFVGFFIGVFTLLILVYSLRFIKEKRISYYIWILITAVISLGVVFTNHILLVIVLWGFLGLTLFKLMSLYSGEDAAKAAKKTFIIVGASDGLLLFGFIIYYYLNANWFLVGSALPIKNSLSFLAFILIACACFAKAGCMPFHSWIPDAAQYAPLPVVAYLPASLDKLLGIYLLARIVNDTFILNDLSKSVLLIFGAITVLGAVMMALVQHNIKRLLGYHAVSQVGYMVLGVGCASPLGLVGGLFHMLNNAIYKSCLFLGAGNIEERVKSSEFKDLGGLARFMPITFITTLIASLSISGIPPFNGFVSKWVVYQGLIDFLNNTSSSVLKIIISLSLVFALIGSGLTLASFLKLMSGVFLGGVRKKVKEVGISLYSPAIVLALLCIALGLFSYPLALKFIQRTTGQFSVSGLWAPNLATNFIILGFILGFVFFKFSAKSARVTSSYIGGEILEDEVKPEDFYGEIRNLNILKNIYKKAEEKYFDIYGQTSKLVFWFIKILRFLHNGVLPTYLVWCLLGMMGLFLVFFR